MYKRYGFALVGGALAFLLTACSAQSSDTAVVAEGSRSTPIEAPVSPPCVITVDCDLHGVSGVAITRIPEGFQAAADGPMTQRSDDGIEYATMQSFVSSGFRVPGANGPQPGTVTVVFFSNGTNAENFEANLSPGATTGVPAPDRGEETTEMRVGERPGTLRDSLRKLPIAGGEAAVPDSTLTMRLSSSAGVRILGEGVPGSVLVRFAEGMEAQR